VPRARRAIWLTYAALVAQALMRAFWPLYSIVLATVGLYFLGLAEPLSIEAAWIISLGIGLSLIWAMYRGLRTLSLPTLFDAERIVDKALRNHPISVLRETRFVGTDHLGADALWAVHIDQMQKEAQQAKTQPVDFRLSRMDPFGLRYIALLFATMGVLFGSLSRVADLAISSASAMQIPNVITWEGWVTPPDYTGLPQLYLNDLTDRDELELLAGSRILVQFYGAIGDHILTESVSRRIQDVPAATDQKQEFTIAQSGEIAIIGQNPHVWKVTLRADDRPTVTLDEAFETDFFGVSKLGYRVTDDYGISEIRAKITLDLDKVDRRYGLSVSPNANEPMFVEILLPIAGNRKDFAEIWQSDFSKEVWVHLPVVMTLSARDAAGQWGQSVPMILDLPGRRFFDPVSSAIIEMRRDLLWSLQNTDRVTRMMRMVRYQPETAFRNGADLTRLSAILDALETAQDDAVLEAKLPEIAEELWSLAIEIEEGDVDDALQRMREAQERLNQAMKNGASPQEIERLMQELKEANENYMRQLRQQSERAERKEFEQSTPGEQMNMDMADIQAMMDRLQELMEQGRMAEAQQALDELQKMMENLRLSENSEGGEGGQSSAQGLADILQDQQDLSDDAFNDLQEEFSNLDGQQGQGEQNGESEQSRGQGENQGSDFADRQGQLRESLERERSKIEGALGEEGEDAQRSLEQADRAMRRAEEALKNGDLDGAVDQQAQAMDALRQGIRDVNRAERSANSDVQQGNSDQHTGQGRDPLGRPQGGDGSSGTTEARRDGQDPEAQAAELLEEIRRRAGERERSETERDYLKRLLDLF
jgi:uncharacterized protein (TIGR02302 family)